MRQNLRQHLNEYVLCRGWIGGWEDLNESTTRRIYVNKPTIKKADKHLLFKEQKLISIEDHHNLFVKYEDMPTYDTIFELNQPIRFGGVIEKYIRGNGSIDYGVCGSKQSALDFFLDQFIKSISETINYPLEEIDNLFLEQAGQRILLTLEEVERADDRIPTFEKTYQEYKDILLSLFMAVTQTLSRTRAILGSRKYRRSSKNRIGALETAKTLYSPRKDASKKARKLMNKLRDL